MISAIWHSGKGQIMERAKSLMLVSFEGWRKRGMKWGNYRILGHWNYSYGTIMVETRYSTIFGPTECTPPRVNPSVNCVLWMTVMTVMSWCRFTDCSERVALVGMLMAGVWVSEWVSEWKLLSSVRLFATPWAVARQAPLSMEFSRQEYWDGSPFPSPRNLRNPGVKPRPPTSRVDSLPSEPPRKPRWWWEGWATV